MKIAHSSPGWTRAARLAGAAALLVLALVVARASVPLGADLYDEGLIANGGALALQGQWPAASYYAPYPPGAFGALALAFRLCGVRLIVERWFAALLAALAAVLGFWLISGFGDRSQPARPREAVTVWLAAAAAALLLAARWVTPVNGGALALVLASGVSLRAALASGGVAGAFGCGALIGAAALWRLDFGLYALLAALPVWLLYAGAKADNRLTRGRRLAGALAMGLGTLAVWGPPVGWVLAHGGERAAECLFWWPLSSTSAARLPWTRHAAAFLTPLGALLFFVRALPALRRDPARLSTAVWLTLLGLGFLLYALGRTHATHLLPLRVVALLLAGLTITLDPAKAALTESSGVTASAAPPSPGPTSGRLAASAFVAILLAAVIGPLREYGQACRRGMAHRMTLPGRRGAGVFAPREEVRDYDRIVAYLSREVPAGAPLYCGTARHDVFLKDDNLAYFLSGRQSGTYFWCLDAAVTSTQPVQAEMARELETSRVPVVLIRTAALNREPNAGSRSSGAHLLDNYLRAHFQPVATWDDYRICRRRQQPPRLRSGR